MNISLESFVLGFQRSAENISQTLAESKQGLIEDVLIENYCEDIEWSQKQKLIFLVISSPKYQSYLIESQIVFNYYKKDISDYLGVDPDCFDW